MSGLEKKEGVGLQGNGPGRGHGQRWRCVQGEVTYEYSSEVQVDSLAWATPCRANTLPRSSAT